MVERVDRRTSRTSERWRCWGGVDGQRAHAAGLTFRQVAGVSPLVLLALSSCSREAIIATNEPRPPAPSAASSLRFAQTGHRLVNERLYVAHPSEGTLTPQRQPSLDQEQLLAGKYSLAVVLEAGQNQFNLPFDPEHGFGEGARGPRSEQRAVWNPRGGTGANTAWPFLRVNGIDSQSCFECHSSIGQYVPPYAKTTAQVRKPGAEGGPAGAGNTAFINDQFPEELAQLTTLGPDGKPIAVLTKFARNPPVVFGTGYTQRLATEMTTELMAQQAAVVAAAQGRPGTAQTIALTSKDQAFGTLSATCSSADEASCTVDSSQVQGVQPDLIVRPFQWGGISSSVRHFARDALDFHFSVQAIEKVGHLDCDQDGLIDEITVGNVTALTAYVAMFRPPAQVVPPGAEARVQRGRELLTQVGCTSCHSDQMRMDSPTLTIQTPPPYTGDCPQEVSTLGGPAGPEGSGSVQQAKLHVQAALQVEAVRRAIAAAAQPRAIYAAMRPHLMDPKRLAPGNYQIDLNLTGVAKGDVPAYVWPRLQADAEGRTQVPLYSDLRLHFMGAALADDYGQPTDGSYVAEPGVYVTRVLWGIGDTAPYMHDGRARSLEEAIALHGVSGSEAEPVHAKFAALPAADQQAIIAFLESQKLPISEGVTQNEYVATADATPPAQYATPRPAVQTELASPGTSAAR